MEQNQTEFLICAILHGESFGTKKKKKKAEQICLALHYIKTSERAAPKIQCSQWKQIACVIT